jgi:hypothetical protein
MKTETGAHTPRTRIMKVKFNLHNTEHEGLCIFSTTQDHPSHTALQQNTHTVMQMNGA